MDIKAVAFDLDGTLYPDIYLYIRSIPFFVSHPRVIYFFNKMRKEVRKLDKIENLRVMQGEIMARTMGITLERALRLIDEIVYEKWKKYFAGMKLYPYVHQTLIRLKDDGYMLAILSDYPLQSKLSILGIESIWDYCVSSEETNHLKPHPEPFKYIQQKLGVPFPSILYVGDRYKYDVLGAKNVGMKAALFTRKKIEGSIADISFSDYRELYKKITQKNI